MHVQYVQWCTYKMLPATACQYYFSLCPGVLLTYVIIWDYLNIKILRLRQFNRKVHSFFYMWKIPYSANLEKTLSSSSLDLRVKVGYQQSELLIICDLQHASAALLPCRFTPCQLTSSDIVFLMRFSSFRDHPPVSSGISIYQGPPFCTRVTVLHLTMNVANQFASCRRIIPQRISFCKTIFVSALQILHTT